MESFSLRRDALNVRSKAQAEEGLKLSWGGGDRRVDVTDKTEPRKE